MVALTGYGQPEDQRRSLQAGFDVHLIKPVDVQAINKLLLQVEAPGMPVLPDDDRWLISRSRLRHRRLNDGRGSLIRWITDRRRQLVRRLFDRWGHLVRRHGRNARPRNYRRFFERRNRAPRVTARLRSIGIWAGISARLRRRRRDRWIGHRLGRRLRLCLGLGLRHHGSSGCNLRAPEPRPREEGAWTRHVMHLGHLMQHCHACCIMTHTGCDIVAFIAENTGFYGWA